MNQPQTVNVAYGKGSIPLTLSPLAEWEIIQPQYEAPLADAEEVFLEACRKPVGCPPLCEIIKETDRVVVATSDGTRAVPNNLLIPWLLKALPCPAENVTVVLGTGTHRPNTPEEIAAMFGSETAKKVRIINHNCFEPSENLRVGCTSTGGETFLNKDYVEADKRIVLGFIEPHFFAGFSGGAKGIVPAIASRDTIFHMHSAKLIADPKSTWGILDDNPLRQEIEEMVGLCPPDFMINVTLNLRKEISALFAGHYQAAHRPGCEHVRKMAMRKLPHQFPIVITSNSGFPLDQNLYQTVKGLSAAARVVEQDGIIFVASECSDGVPNHGNFASLMRVGSSAQDILDHIFGLESPVLDQWQAQTLAGIMNRARVVVYSSMNAETIQACKLHPISDLQKAVDEAIASLGRGVRVAVLPDGPLNIPYVQ